MNSTASTVDSVVKVVPTLEQVKKIAMGVSIILKHFDGHQQLFPRYLLLGPECRRLIVYNARQIIDACLEVGLIDCRIMAYPICPDSLKEIAPCEILIDIDYDKSKPCDVAKRQAMHIKNKTVKRIRELFQTPAYYNPTILETGNGYHIYIVLATRPLEYSQILKNTVCSNNNPSQEFLKWIAKKCSCGKSDSNNTPAFRSCYWRLPYTFNSKNGAEVKVISEFTLALQIPDALLVDFRMYLEDKDTGLKLAQDQRQKITIDSNNNNDRYDYHYSNNPQYNWIENKLMQIGIDDCRKCLVWSAIGPYLIHGLGLSEAQARDRIVQWLFDKCAALRPIDFDYNNKIREALDGALGRNPKAKKYRPISLKALKNDKPEIYSFLKAKEVI